MKYILPVDFYRKTHKTTPLLLYQGDFGATIEFVTNLNLESMEMVAFAMLNENARVIIKTPSSRRIIANATIQDNVFRTIITPDMTLEVGEYKYQLRTESGSYKYTSPELNYKVERLVISEEDAVAGVSITGYVFPTSDNFTYVTNENSYEKTLWVEFETLISASRLNKIEDELEKLNIYKSQTNHTHNEYATTIALANKVDVVAGKGLSTNDYTTVEKNKLATLQNYTHPLNHEASMIVQTATNRFVSDAEKTIWNNKSNFDGNYNSLTGKPTIPTLVSQLQNDLNYLTEITAHLHDDRYNTKDEINSIILTINNRLNNLENASLVLTSGTGYKFRVGITDTGALTTEKIG
ncbi:MAG: hypothetical protein ACRC92_21850 [Peptostreptococcaceae bacterium]